MTLEGSNPGTDWENAIFDTKKAKQMMQCSSQSLTDYTAWYIQAKETYQRNTNREAIANLVVLCVLGVL